MIALRSRQRGITLLEILASMAIMSAVIAGVAKLADQYITDTKTALTAQQLVTVGNAAQAYIKDNYSTVLANATATTPALITVSMLTSAGYLQSGFSTKNNFGQDVCVLVLEPSANNLNALVVAEGGTAIDDLTLGSVALSIGAAGGGIYSSAPTFLQGAMGGWKVGIGNFANANNLGQTCGGAGGAPAIAPGHPIMALWFANGDVTAGFLYRNAVPGRPELNTMNTPILMGSVQANNGVCTSTGAIARDNNGAVLSCQGGFWKTQGSAFWKDPVANFAALPAGDPLGAVRMTTDTGRAFMWTGGAWAALAVDQNGNMTIPGTVTMAGGRVIAWNQASEGGTITLQGANGVNVYLESNNGTFRLLNSPWNAELFRIDQNGNLVMDERGNGYGTVTPGWAVETWGCSPNGAIGRAAYDTTNGWAYSGITLSCQSGVWKKTQGAGVRALVSWLPQSCTPFCPLTNSSNVASVLRNGAGDFTIVFSTAFPSSVYSFVANSDAYTAAYIYNPWTISQTAAALRIRITAYVNVPYDPASYTVVVF